MFDALPGRPPPAARARARGRRAAGRRTRRSRSPTTTRRCAPAATPRRTRPPARSTTRCTTGSSPTRSCSARYPTVAGPRPPTRRVDGDLRGHLPADRRARRQLLQPERHQRAAAGRDLPFEPRPTRPATRRPTSAGRSCRRRCGTCWLPARPYGAKLPPSRSPRAAAPTRPVDDQLTASTTTPATSPPSARPSRPGSTCAATAPGRCWTISNGPRATSSASASSTSTSHPGADQAQVVRLVPGGLHLSCTPAGLAGRTDRMTSSMRGNP